MLGPELEHLRTAIVEPDRFGGTCLNRGCIPSKMFVVAADVARTVAESGRLGVHARLDRVDWSAVRDRVFGRIDPMHADAVDHRRRAGVDVFLGEARFVGEREIDVDGERLTAPSIVVATGARPVIPDIAGLNEVPFHTSDTIMRLQRLPESLVIVGGGFIAAEMAHVFGAFGTDVTIVARGPRLLMTEDEEISARFTELAAARFRVLLDADVTRVGKCESGVSVTVERAGTEHRIEASTLLVATGRRPNTDRLDVAHDC